MEIDVGRAVGIVVGWTLLVAAVHLITLQAYRAGRLPRWTTALAWALTIGLMPIMASTAAGFGPEPDTVVIGIGLFVAAFIAFRRALNRQPSS